MLDASQKTLLNQLLSSLTRDQQIWLSGYVWGKAEGGEAVPTLAAQQEKPAVEIFYATETGNSKALALQVMNRLKNAGYKAKNSAVNRLKLEALAQQTLAIFLISTHGEGDPPESARAFFDMLTQASEGALRGLSYAVLGLGDSSYTIFCGAATTLDAQLTRLGATSLHHTTLLDVDYAAHTDRWMDALVQSLDSKFGATASITATSSTSTVTHTGKGYSRLEPVEATVQHSVILNDRESNKQTYHLELVPNAPLAYACGDALGIMLPLGADGKEPTPRLYSIASSPLAHAGEIHLTVALATHRLEDGSIGYGLASHYLASLKAGDTVRVYVAQNQLFKLPSPDVDMIMIGPGTGIAPFRGFVYERSEAGATGRNWLFFGDQHAHCDFLYQAEWQEHIATGALSRIDLAFSRDQEHKVYVQHKMLERANELMAWIRGGASIYVCGAKDPMSHDVDAALRQIIMSQEGIDDAKAADYLADLAEAGRYVKDVY
jgi:sulfite reductase alpha subunit-like flavoprotein